MSSTTTPELPYPPPIGWAGFGATSGRRANVFLVVFGAIAVLSIATIVRTGDVASGLIGAAIFGSLAVAGWGIGRMGKPSRRPTELVNSVVLTDASSRTPDNWVHLARIRPVPWGLVLALAIIGTLAAAAALWLFFGSSDVAVEPGEEIILYGVGGGCALGAVFFLWAAAASIVTQMKNTGWPGRYGITLGVSGIAFRLVGESRDIPWHTITRIEALLATADNPRQAAVPVLRVQSSAGDRDYHVGILGVSPVMLYNALRYYLEHPAERSELGTVVARDRMAGWIP